MLALPASLRSGIPTPVGVLAGIVLRLLAGIALGALALALSIVLLIFGATAVWADGESEPPAPSPTDVEPLEPVEPGETPAETVTVAPAETVTVTPPAETETVTAPAETITAQPDVDELGAALAEQAGEGCGTVDAPCAVVIGDQERTDQLVAAGVAGLAVLVCAGLVHVVGSWRK